MERQKGLIAARPLRTPVLGLFVLALLYTLYLASEILIPIAAAILLALLLEPLVRGLARLHVIPPIGAALVLVGLFVGIAGGVSLFAPQAEKWLAQMPDIVAEVREKIEGPIEQVKSAKKEVEDALDEKQEQTEPEAVTPTYLSERGVVSEPDEKAEETDAAEPAPESGVTLIELLFQTVAVFRSIGWTFFITFFLLYFLLSTGDMIRENFIAALPADNHRRRVLIVARNVQRSVSTYFAVIALINVGLAVVMSAALYAIGLPNPALWGAIAGILNFIPYLGPLAGAGIVTVVGLVSFETPLDALGPPLIYIAINALEGNLVTPMLLSNRLTLNPLAVFLFVVFWAWMWGVAGALMAVPMLACLKAVCDSDSNMAPFGALIGSKTAKREA